MSQTQTARDRVLASIRTSLHADSAKPQKMETADQLHQRWAAPHAPLSYERSGTRTREEKLTLLIERLRDYDTEVHLCASTTEVPQAILSILGARGAHTLALPPAFPAALLPTGTAVQWLRDEPLLTNDQLNAVDGVLTCATVAVAISGSIALQHGPSQGRRVLTLLPDFHLCVLFTSQVVETLPEALDRLHPTATQTTTFFSGPSATADIEMTRIKGVHGPRFLSVILVADG